MNTETIPPHTQPTNDDKNIAMLLHLSQLADFCLPFGGLFLPIVIWSLKKDQSPFIREVGIEIINWSILRCIMLIVSSILCLLLIGFIFIGLIYVVNLFFILIGALKASEGINWKIPFNFIQFLK
jgi:hypothetical protein